MRYILGNCPLFSYLHGYSTRIENMDASNWKVEEFEQHFTHKFCILGYALFLAQIILYSVNAREKKTPRQHPLRVAAGGREVTKSSSSAHKAQRIEYLNLCDLKSIQNKSNLNGISFPRCEPHNSYSPLPYLLHWFGASLSGKFPGLTFLPHLIHPGRCVTHLLRRWIYFQYSPLENCSVRTHPSSLAVALAKDSNYLFPSE